MTDRTEANRDDEADEPRRYASSPCAMADVDPAYRGRLPALELVQILNELLEGERAGARVLNATCVPAAPPADRATLHAVAVDEGRFCVMLHHHIMRLAGVPSDATGAFAEKFAGVDSHPARLALLNRGQAWVVRRLRDILPRIDDPVLHADLVDMLEVHECNIARCDALIAIAGP